MMLNKPKIAVVIPAINEETTIHQVIKSILDRGLSPIVVDDGSTDKTAKIAKEAGALVISHDINKGYESALSTGVHAAAEKKYDLVATFDADGQLDPNDIIKFALVLDSKKCDLVIGIRNYRNRYSEYLLSMLGRIRFGIKDPLCGLKLYRLKSAIQCFPFDSCKLVGMELAFKMIERGSSFYELPIKVVRRDGESRYGSSFRGEVRILNSFFRAINKFGLIKPTK